MYEIFNYFEIGEDYRITSLSGRDIFDIDNSIQGFRHFAFRLEKLRDIEEDEWKKKTMRELSESMYRLAEDLKNVSVNIKINMLSNKERTTDELTNE